MTASLLDLQPVATCIDLKERFGRKYRVRREDETYTAEYGQGAIRHDPWLLLIPCQFGHIFPWGGNLLAFSSDRRGGTAKKVAALACTTVEQDGEDGITCSFDVQGFAKVAALVKPRTRRQLTPEQRARLVEQGRAALKAYQQTNVQSDSSDR